MTDPDQRLATAEAREPAAVIKPRVAAWRRPGVLGGVLLCGMVFGAGSFALAQNAPMHFGWRHGPPLERIQQHVLHVLDGVGATTAQETRIHDIVAAAFAAIDNDRTDRTAMRQQMIALLRAPTIDRAAVEKLRADQVAKYDAKSKAIVGALLDSADQLTPDQRVKLADRADSMMQRGGMGGHWGGDREGWGRKGPHPEDNGPRPEDGPGHGPDTAPDKG